MRTPVDASLREEVRRLSLRYRCGDCAHFETITGTCAEGFPNDGHRDDSVERDDTIEFCKSFELG